jgi:hypothetical protein
MFMALVAKSLVTALCILDFWLLCTGLLFTGWCKGNHLPATPNLAAVD